MKITSLQINLGCPGHFFCFFWMFFPNPFHLSRRMLLCCFGAKLQKMFCGLRNLAGEKIMTEFPFLDELFFETDTASHEGFMKISLSVDVWSAGLPLDTQETVLRKLRGGGLHRNCSLPLSQLCVCVCVWVYTALTVDLRNLRGFDAALRG